MLPIVALAAAALLAGILGYAASRPDEFRVQRATRIKAPPEKILPRITDFRRWTDWSPWEKMDPALKRSFSGAATGKGAIYEWEGNNKVGTGRMEITDVSPPSRVTIKLDFLKPWKAHNIAEFTLAPQDDSTDVTWTMHGPSPFATKVMGVFVSMDKLVGKDFEKGLANLKAAVEA